MVNDCNNDMLILPILTGMGYSFYNPAKIFIGKKDSIKSLSVLHKTLEILLINLR